MPWSKVKTALQRNICDSLRRRIAFHMAAYGADGRVWIALDGVEGLRLRKSRSHGPLIEDWETMP